MYILQKKIKMEKQNKGVSLSPLTLTKDHPDDWQATDGHTTEGSADSKHGVGSGESWNGSQHGGGD